MTYFLLTTLLLIICILTYVHVCYWKRFDVDLMINKRNIGDLQNSLDNAHDRIATLEHDLAKLKEKFRNV